MSPQQAAHLRMLSTLPVRTHVRPERAYHTSVHFMTPVKTVVLKAAIRKLKAEGKGPREIARIRGCSIQTVYNHLRKR
jgi:hypothetical protein